MERGGHCWKVIRRLRWQQPLQWLLYTELLPSTSWQMQVICLSPTKGKKPLCSSKYELHRECGAAKEGKRRCRSKTWVIQTVGVQSHGANIETPLRGHESSAFCCVQFAKDCICRCKAGTTSLELVLPPNKHTLPFCPELEADNS
jgi:hypothetical protein